MTMRDMPASRAIRAEIYRRVVARPSRDLNGVIDQVRRDVTNELLDGKLAFVGDGADLHLEPIPA
jgi:hypothetical protein